MKMKTETEDFKLNGITADRALKEIYGMHNITEKPKDGTAPEHPDLKRQRRISDNTQSLEGKVKEVLGSSLKATKDHADNIIKNLAYALAQTEGYKGKIEELKDEQVRTYLSHASSALGNPTIGNQIEFIKSIINMPSAKPGDPTYDANSHLAQLIRYIATQKDEETRREAYITSKLAEAWTQPDKGLKLQDKVRGIFKIPLNRTATANDALGEISRLSALEAQKYATTTGKTFLDNAVKYAKTYRN